MTTENTETTVETTVDSPPDAAPVIVRNALLAGLIHQALWRKRDEDAEARRAKEEAQRRERAERLERLRATLVDTLGIDLVDQALCPTFDYGPDPHSRFANDEAPQAKFALSDDGALVIRFSFSERTFLSKYSSSRTEVPLWVEVHGWNALHPTLTLCPEDGSDANAQHLLVWLGEALEAYVRWKADATGSEDDLPF